MHGRRGGGGEERKRSRHMLTVPTADGSSSSSSNSTNYFFKDGRKISVGDCALFKPPQDSPPFIGIIRWLITGKENKLRIGVNWLYRPSEVKLGKGIQLDAELNEIFYSFHKDEIPAASLLHPCKVAFLPKGSKLPSGISSFVCWRVYDITNKCLWWLTDQDYIKVRQEEVDKLLYKTQVEMHATTVHSGGRSPKPMNGPSSASQLKAGSDGVQNSASSFSSQVKGKKRERGDQGSEPVKRERITRKDDGDSGHCKQESTLKLEIAKITERGGLVDSDGVEKLIQLMVPDRNDKKIDMAGRSLLASVLAATDKYDCLSQFVQLRGLPVFDEWLQEVHKGKIGDGSASKDSDKCVEEFLLVSLRALDKLPVNLNALQMCNIGKSVNHLRTHKNLDIQKKARSLVDTWKKRVEAEMKINEAKSGLNQAVPWSARPRLPEVSHGGNRHSGASTDVVMKSSVTQLSVSNKSSVKLVQGDNITKSASASPVSLKSVPSPVSAGSNLKDGQSRTPAGVAVDLPMTTTRDEKSSSSSQSHNNSQSCSNDQARNGGVSGKEDARSSTAGSMNKTSGGSSRPRKSTNGLPGSTPSGAQRELSSRSTSLHKNPASEKSLQQMASEKMGDVPVVEGNHNKLIVKIPNQGRSPAQSGSGGSFDDHSNMNSRASSPMHSEKHDQLDSTLKEKVDVYRATGTSDVNTESWQSNDFKDILTGLDEGDGSPAAVTNEECDPKNIADAPKAASSSSGNEQKPGNTQEASFSSMHALVESCVKYSEVNASVRDDLGMNLLASVAADEMCKSESPTDSPQRSNPVSEYPGKGNDSRVKSPLIEDLARDEGQSNTGVHDDEYQKHGSDCATIGTKEGGGKGSFPENKPIQVTFAPAVTSCPSIAVEDTLDSEGTKPSEEKRVVGGVSEVVDIKQGLTGHLSSETKGNDASSRAVNGKEATEESSLNPALEVDGKLSTLHVHSEPVKGTSEDVMLSSEKVSARKADNMDEMEDRNCSNQTERQRPESNNPVLSKKESDNPLVPENRAVIGSSSAVTNHNGEHMEEILESKVADDQLSEPVVLKVKPDLPKEEVEHVRSKRSKITGREAEEGEECTSTGADTPMSAVGVSDMDAKLEFDLNEGFNADDGKFGEPNNLTAPGCSTALRLISPLLFSVSSLSSGHPASVTVPSAAKGPCVPPDDLLKGKQEDGWKGTAATSAFRPAEPRKVLELQLGGATNIAVPDPTAGKQGRPALDIDLNVPDERVLEDMASQEIFSLSVPTSNNDVARNQSMSMAPIRSSGGLDLDLNQVDEASEIGSYSLSNIHRMNNPILSTKASAGPLNGEVSLRRDFDLNDGPTFDDGTAEPAVFNQHIRSSVPSQPPISGFRMSSSTEVGNSSSWFSPANTYSAVTIPSIMPDREEQPFPIVTTGGPQRTGPHTGSNPFTPDVYRGSMVSSSPAVPYPSTSFPYPVFPFGSSFPLPSAMFAGGSTTYLDSSAGRLCIPAVRSQLLGPGNMIPSNYPRPYVANVPDGSNNSSAENNRKWGRQGLDLNAGPGGPDLEGTDVTSPLAPWQFSVASSQALAQEQARMFQMPGGTFKLKEPEGGCDGYKQPSWKGM